jgi:hypothetical protein
MQELGTKVSAMDPAGPLSPADQLYLIQNGVSVRIALATFLASLPNALVRFGGLVALDTPSQTIANTGTVNSLTVLTTYTADNSLQNVLSIDDGTVEGQLKIILHLGGSGDISLQGDNIASQGTSLDVPAMASIFLMWIGTKWYPIGGFGSSWGSAG